MQALEDLLTSLPDLATGANGPFELDGIDRPRVRDGLVCRNYVFFDSAQFQQLVGT